jgi:hypothetical protein
MRQLLSAVLGLTPSVHAWLTEGGGEGGRGKGGGEGGRGVLAVSDPGMAGWLTEHGLPGLAADSAYWLVLGGFSVAGGHVASLLTTALTPTPNPTLALALALTPTLASTLL